MFLLFFSLAGVLFSGYLTASKIFAGSCPLTEGCPNFLGYPACIYGLAMFAVLLAVSVLLLKKRPDAGRNKLLKTAMAVSALGILFSGYFSYQEIFYPACPGGKCVYSLLMPSCIYGLAMYLAIFLKAYFDANKS